MIIKKYRRHLPSVFFYVRESLFLANAPEASHLGLGVSCHNNMVAGKRRSSFVKRLKSLC